MKMTYAEAIRDAQEILLNKYPEMILCGLGVPDVKGVFGSTVGLKEQFGERRVFDTPASENATVGMLMGASFQGVRSIMVNQRVDFMFLALDQLINHASKWKWMFGHRQSVPLVIRMIIGRGWGQGPQHSQSLHGLFGHFPGLKVVAPSNPSDVKGMLIAALEDPDPVVFLEHRRLYDSEAEVAEGYYRTPLDQASIVRIGEDLTIVSASQMLQESLAASDYLQTVGIAAEVVDLKSLNPIDSETIFKSVRKTGRLLVVDGDWKACSISGEVLALVSENCFDILKVAPRRVCWPDLPAPTSEALEKKFYPSLEDIVRQATAMVGKEALAVKSNSDSSEQVFTGSF